MRRALCLLIALSLAACCAAAEATDAPQPTMAPEEIRLTVEALFMAAAGTDAESEKLIRKEMTGEELDERNAARAEYRAMTLPWLIEALRPTEEPATDASPDPSSSPSPSPSPTPVPTPSPAPGESAEPTAPVWTIEDSWAAFQENEWGKAYVERLRMMGAEDMESCMALTKEICGLWMDEVDHEKLSGMNEDYACWIYAPGTQIDYPVVHGEDNSYYLKRLFSGEKNSAGTLFIDYRNLPDFQDPNTLIYGHHMRNDSMFGTLTDYVNQAYYEAHPYILLMSAEEICIVELFAGYTTNDRDHCYDIAISDEEDMKAFLNEALRKTNFLSFVQVEPFDRLVTLSTCAYAFENARYIALGRIETVWRKGMTADDAAG